MSDSIEMFVKVVPIKNDKVSVRVMENQTVGKKVKAKTIYCVGNTHKDNTKEIEEFKKTGRDVIQDLILNEEAPDIEKLEDSSIKELPLDLQIFFHNLNIKERVPVGFSDIFGGFYEQLKLSEYFGTGPKQKPPDDLLKEMLLHHLERMFKKPKPNYNNYRFGFFGWELIEERALDELLNDGTEEIKEKWGGESDQDRLCLMVDKLDSKEALFKKRIYEETMSRLKGKMDTLFIDVKTFYFNSFVIKDLKTDKGKPFEDREMVFVLMRTEKGLPVGYHLFPRKNFKSSTVIQTISKMSSTYNLKNIYLVIERGLFSKEEINELNQQGVKSIFVSRLNTLKPEEKADWKDYKNLWPIKKSFRLRNTGLYSSPAEFSQIKADFLISFIVYTVACFVQEIIKNSGLDLNFDKIREELKEVYVLLCQDQLTKREFHIPVSTTKTQKLIYKAFNKKPLQKTKFLDQ